VLLVLDEGDLLLIVGRLGVAVVNLDPLLAVLVFVEVVAWVVGELLGGYLEKTYLSMRYYLRPSSESSLNLSGSD